MFRDTKATTTQQEDGGSINCGLWLDEMNNVHEANNEGICHLIVNRQASALCFSPSWAHETYCIHDHGWIFNDERPLFVEPGIITAPTTTTAGSKWNDKSRLNLNMNHSVQTFIRPVPKHSFDRHPKLREKRSSLIVRVMGNIHDFFYYGVLCFLADSAWFLNDHSGCHKVYG